MERFEALHAQLWGENYGEHQSSEERFLGSRAGVFVLCACLRAAK